MRISIATPAGTHDIDVAGADSTLSIAELAAAAGWDQPPAVLCVDGSRYQSSDPLSVVNLFEGSRITSDVAPTAPALVELVRLAGVGAGQHLGLQPGTYDVGASAVTESHLGQPDQPHFRLAVQADGQATITALAPGVLVEGASAAEPRGGQVVTTPDAVYRVEPVGAIASTRGQRHGGRILMTRSPRMMSPSTIRVVDTPIPPEPVREALPISWLVALAPVPIGIVLALVLSPYFLAFAALSPIISLARWRDGRKRVRREKIEQTRYVVKSLSEFASQIRAQADNEARSRRDGYCDVRRQERVVEHGGAHLWEVRADHADFLQVTVGLGESPWIPELNHRAAMEGLDDVVRACGYLVSSPVTVDLAEVGAIGIVGDVVQARRVASALVLESMVRQGPADIELSCLLDPGTVDGWRWIKWLPHLYTSTGDARLALTDQAARALLERPAPTRRSYAALETAAAPRSLLLIDGQDHLSAGVSTAAAMVNRSEAVALVVAERADDLPAFCGAVLHVDSVGNACLTNVAAAEVVGDLTLPLAAPATVERAARLLSRYSDPDLVQAAAQLTDQCQLSQVLATPLTPEVIASTWRQATAQPRTSLIATLGLCVEGRFDIDLVRDGPHALIAGTTGAGKSELLRTMVASLAWRYSPEDVTFVLVDFKGGGAFDSCANLPHTVGVVTDLDASLAARALRCLRAELQHRERQLRAAGVSDIADMPTADRDPDAAPMPRLVIVVDEFATLAKELPEFMESLVDVAQRGRSLGIHMVLATQRPAGVVDAKIRANTNLRIALRVQDESDAIEVIGSAVAADIHRTQPGRGFARLGAEEIVSFQAAMVSTPPPGPTGAVLRLASFDLISPSQQSAPAPTDDESRRDAPTELDVITQVAQHTVASLDIAAPRVPWPAPLPDTAPLGELDQSGNAPWRVAVGLVDRPDEQRCGVFHWSGADDGNVLIYGVESTDAAEVLGSFCAAIASAHSPAEAHLYVVDFAGALSALGDLPQVGGYLGPEDDERIARLLNLLESELEARRRVQRDKRAASLGPADVPLLGVFVANYAGLLEQFEEAGDLDAAIRLASIVRDGPALGMFMFASGAGERGIPMKVAAHVATKFVLRMADSGAYTAFGLRGSEVPDMGPGRAIDVRSKLEIQFAKTDFAGLLPHDDSAPPAAGGPVRLRTLDTTIPLTGLTRLGGTSRVSPELWKLAIGVDHDDLGTAYLELRPGVHAVIGGPPASGRSTALRTIAAALESAAPNIAIGSIGLDGVGTPLDTPDGVVAFATAGGLLLIDDLELVRPDLAAIIESLVAKPPPELRLVVAGRTETLRGMQATTRLLTAGRTGMLLRPQADAGDVFRCRLRFKGPFPAGRGVLLNGGTGGVVQFAHTADLADPMLLQA